MASSPKVSAGWLQRRRARQDSRILLKESRRLMRKYRERLKPPVVDEIEEVAAAVSEAREDTDVEVLRRRYEKLDGLLERHLAFGRKSALREYGESIGVAVIIALILRAFVIEAFKIPSGSMIPTLKVGDHLFVTKIPYGLRIPYTRVKFFARSPKRGEVVVFIFPKDPTKDFIKRVAAVAGDEVEVRNNIVYVNGKALPRRRLHVPCHYRDQDTDSHERGEIRACVAYEEKNGENRYRVVQDVPSLSLDYPKTEVPPRHVFVMGDNRDDSYDGRAWGFVPIENIKGKAIFIWWSSGPPEGVRWSRFFDMIHGYGPKRREAPVQDGLLPEEVPPAAQAVPSPPTLRPTP